MAKDRFQDAEFRKYLKEAFPGWTDYDLDNLNASQRTLLLNLEKARQYRLVAEIVEAKGCARKPNIGDKYVFTATGNLLVDESTIKGICLAAISPMISWVWMTYDRVVAGTELTAPFWLDKVRCLDMGPEHGGYGKVLFKMYVVKAQQVRLQ